MMSSDAPSPPLRIVKDDGTIDHSLIDRLLSRQMSRLDGWINDRNVRRWFWTTTRAMALSTAYELLQQVEKCGKDGAHAAAFLLMSRLDYATPFVGRGSVGWSFKQLSIVTGDWPDVFFGGEGEFPSCDNIDDVQEKVWTIISSHSGIPEVSAFFTEEDCRRAWNEAIDDDDCAERGYTMERYDSETGKSWSEPITAELAWKEGWCEMHKDELRWDCITVEGRGERNGE